MDGEVATDSHLFVHSSVIVPVQTRKWSNCLNVLKGPQSLQREVAGNHLNRAGRAGPEGCIPECFDGHYRVKHDPGLHFPVNSWDALTAAPFRRAPPQSAEETWPRFFIAVRISSRDS